MMGEMSRRRLVGAAAAISGGALLTTMGPVGAAHAAPATGETWQGTRSANGWPLLQQARWHPIEGSDQKVRLADGDAAVILTHVARRFHYEIDRLRDGDVHGYLTSSRVAEPYESNYLSGSALAIRPQAYPVGVKGGLYPNELVVVRDILAELDGVVAWGGDFDRPKESHFEVAYKAGHPRVKGVARKVSGWIDSPGGEGAGAIDAFDPRRRATAKAFARRAA